MQSTSAGTLDIGPKLRPTLLSKVYREIARPFRQKQSKAEGRKPDHGTPQQAQPQSPLANFDPRDCTVEPEGLELLKKLVRESSQFSGPIIEIGTLLGITATQMALVKQPGQKIITVDNYCWNPWALPADAHHLLAQQVLYYLAQTGAVEQVRMGKAEFYETYAGPAPAMVFLDAMHTYEETKADIEWAIRAGAKLIAGHDYCEKFPGVMQIVDELGGPRDLGGSVWVLHSKA